MDTSHRFVDGTSGSEDLNNSFLTLYKSVFEHSTGRWCLISLFVCVCVCVCVCVHVRLKSAFWESVGVGGWGCVGGCGWVGVGVSACACFLSQWACQCIVSIFASADSIAVMIKLSISVSVKGLVLTYKECEHATVQVWPHKHTEQQSKKVSLCAANIYLYVSDHKQLWHNVVKRKWPATNTRWQSELSLFCT